MNVHVHVHYELVRIPRVEQPVHGPVTLKSHLEEMHSNQMESLCNTRRKSQWPGGFAEDDELCPSGSPFLSSSFSFSSIHLHPPPPKRSFSLSSFSRLNSRHAVSRETTHSLLRSKSKVLEQTVAFPSFSFLPCSFLSPLSVLFFFFLLFHLLLSIMH